MFLTVRKCLKWGVAHVSPRCFKSMLFYRVFLCAQITVIFRSKRVLEVFFDVWLRRGAHEQMAGCPFLCIFTCFCTHGEQNVCIFTCAGAPGAASSMHFYLGQHLLCIFTCSGAPGPASSMHFYLLRRPWGSIFYAFLPAPAPLGQHLVCICTWYSHSWGALCMRFYVVFA